MERIYHLVISKEKESGKVTSVLHILQVIQEKKDYITIVSASEWLKFIMLSQAPVDVESFAECHGVTFEKSHLYLPFTDTVGTFKYVSMYFKSASEEESIKALLMNMMGEF